MTEPLKLRVGGVYLNRRGERVLIVRDDFEIENYPFRGDGGHCYTPTGRWGDVDAVTMLDLISEVIEAPPAASIPADYLPPRIQMATSAADLRTRAALAAMTGILADAEHCGDWSERAAAGAAVKQADALIAALKEAPDGTE